MVAGGVGSLLEFYILETSKIMSGWETTWDSAHIIWLYSAATLGNQAASIMTWYPTQLHYPNQYLHYPNNAERQAAK